MIHLQLKKNYNAFSPPPTCLFLLLFLFWLTEDVKGSAEALPNIQCPRKPLPSHSVCLCTGSTVWATSCHCVLSTQVCLHPGSSSREQDWVLRTQDIAADSDVFANIWHLLSSSVLRELQELRTGGNVLTVYRCPNGNHNSWDTGAHLESKTMKNGTIPLHKCQRRKVV